MRRLYEGLVFDEISGSFGGFEGSIGGDFLVIRSGFSGSAGGVAILALKREGQVWMICFQSVCKVADLGSSTSSQEGHPFSDPTKDGAGVRDNRRGRKLCNALLLLQRHSRTSTPNLLYVRTYEP